MQKNLTVTFRCNWTEDCNRIGMIGSLIDTEHEIEIGKVENQYGTAGVLRADPFDHRLEKLGYDRLRQLARADESRRSQWPYKWIERLVEKAGPSVRKSKKTLQTALYANKVIRSMCSLEETLKYVEPGESFPILVTIDLRELGEELALKPVMASHYVKLLVRLGVLEEVDRLRPGGKLYQMGWWKSDWWPELPLKRIWFFQDRKVFKDRLREVLNGQIRLL